jgi:hypothetical protein
VSPVAKEVENIAESEKTFSFRRRDSNKSRTAHQHLRSRAAPATPTILLGSAGSMVPKLLWPPLLPLLLRRAFHAQRLLTCIDEQTIAFPLALRANDATAYP